MSPELPEVDGPREILIGAGLGALTALPVFGPPLATALQAGLAARQTKINEDFLAHLSARITLLERENDEFKFDAADPSFYAAAHQVYNAVHETADETKRRLLASALANSGNWSNVPFDRRERALRTLIGLTAWEMRVLAVLHDPDRWTREFDPSDTSGVLHGGGSSIIRWLQHVIAPGRPEEQHDLAEMVEHLQNLSAVQSISLQTQMTAQGVLEPRTTALGSDIIRLVRPDSELLAHG